MKRRRVKITGLGFVTPAGIGKEAFWKGILEPVSRVRLSTKFPEEAGAFVSADVRDFRLEDYLPNVTGKRMPRHTQFALAAATLAAQDAGITLQQLRGHGAIVMIGATLMDFGVINKGVDIIVKKGPINALPTSVTTALVSAIGAAVGEAIGGTTRAMSLQSACCSGLDAIGRSAEMIANGEAEVAVCGGAEAPLYFHPMLELKLAGLAPGNPDHPERQCRPFDQWRTTGVIGEGACIMVLESENSPRPGYAFVGGYSYASDPAASPCAGLTEAMRLALGNTGLRPRDIECISAWGPGHKTLDAAEARVLQDYFGSELAAIPAVSLKGAIGNPLGAAGAIQVGCAALGLSRSAIPPTVNWEHPDPSCPLNLSGKTRYIAHRNTLINAHGLSGANACLVLNQ
ncbi:MAG: 3-oxoacyl-[acyl-carrier-protein] synthase II [Verrucomicrobia bacterium]|jgi:3-oxoacyl-(acyl-carrier-protein) synthase|nr:MAG: 3-oxoacyl-[acyl-carrier-protein] synthase II [Verrucomicrobiota bacterium]